LTVALAGIFQFSGVEGRVDLGFLFGEPAVGKLLGVAAEVDHIGAEGLDGLLDRHLGAPDRAEVEQRLEPRHHLVDVGIDRVEEAVHERGRLLDALDVEMEQVADALRDIHREADDVVGHAHGELHDLDDEVLDAFENVGEECLDLVPEAAEVRS